MEIRKTTEGQKQDVDNAYNPDLRNPIFFMAVTAHHKVRFGSQILFGILRICSIDWFSKFERKSFGQRDILE
ncbi:hypothetical protein KIN20_015812 [Parelaphostrongylus tenuis]|uniref:Uncharacterized protein n=1 Tax=Parelaphostrongylus tenuis TaxID=148309 RepID=A0AAD5N0R5_PARTN|nr:hypothetical protein KIN20_015812 [Parelaphostrongylus tenuis]